MSKNLKYFMREEAKIEKVVTAPAPEGFTDENGQPIMLEIKALHTGTIQRINEGYKKRSVATDKKGNPLVSDGKVVWKEEFDAARAGRHIMVEALQYPNLQDPELMKFYECVDVTEMPRKVFPDNKEYNHVSDVIMLALGMKDKTEDEEELEAAKNS